MKRRSDLWGVLFGLWWAVAAPASLAAESYLICFPGAPGTAEQAAPMVEKLGAFAAQGLKLQALPGQYLNRLPACRDYIKEKKPLFGIVSPSVYYRYGREWGLTILLETVSSTQADNRFHLVVKKDAPAKWSPAGRTIASSALDQTGFVEALLSQTFAPAEVQKIGWQPTEQILQALNQLAQGRLDGVLLTPLQWASLAALPLRQELRQVWQSPDVGGAPLVAIGERLSPSQSQALAAWLSSPAMPAEGQAALAGLRIDRLSAERLAIYRGGIYGAKR